MGKFLGITGSILALLVGGILVFKFVLPNFHFGNGTGSGTVPQNSISASEPSKSISSEENKISEIRIEENDIYFDNDLMENVDDLKQKITDIGTNHEYTFVYDNAIKSTYDEVNGVLVELENALGITINRKQKIYQFISRAEL